MNQQPEDNSYEKPKINVSKLKAKQSIEELASPAIHDRHLKRLSQPDRNKSMKMSAKHYTHESAKVLESGHH